MFYKNGQLTEGTGQHRGNADKKKLKEKKVIILKVKLKQRKCS